MTRTVLVIVMMCATVGMASFEMAAAWRLIPARWGVTCDCKASHFPNQHLIRPLLLTLGLVCLATSALLLLSSSSPSPGALVLTACAGWHLNRWRRHPKDKNRHPLGKMLARIRQTAAGLKIVPIPAGATS